MQRRHGNSGAHYVLNLLLCDRGQGTLPSTATYLPTQNQTTLNHLLYFFAFGKKVLEMEKIEIHRTQK